jgi:hypothetical protein
MKSPMKTDKWFADLATKTFTAEEIKTLRGHCPDMFDHLAKSWGEQAAAKSAYYHQHEIEVRDLLVSESNCKKKKAWEICNLMAATSYNPSMKSWWPTVESTKSYWKKS